MSSTALLNRCVHKYSMQIINEKLPKTRNKTVSSVYEKNVENTDNNTCFTGDELIDNTNDNVRNGKLPKWSFSNTELRGEKDTNASQPSESTDNLNCCLECITEKDDSLENLTRSETGSSPTKQKIQGFSFCRLPRDKKLILLSVLISDVTCIGFSLMAPFFPKEALIRNVDNTLSGWIFGSFSAFQVLLNLFWGKLLPYGGIRRLYIFGIFVSGIFTLIFGFLAYIDTTDGPELFVMLCFLLRFAMAVGCSAVNTAGFTVIMIAFPDHLGTAVGLSEVFVGLAYMTGPVLGGALYYVGGFVMPFLVIGGLTLLCVPLGMFMFPESAVLDLKTDGSIHESPSVLRLLKSPSFFLICLTVTVTAMTFSLFDPTLEPHLRQFGWGPERVGLAFMMMAAIYSLLSPFWGYVGGRVSDVRILLIPGSILTAIGMLLVGPTPLIKFFNGYNKVWLNILALCVISFFSPACLIPTYERLFSIMKDNGFKDDLQTYSLVAAIWQSCYALGDFLGPMCGGWMLEEIGFPMETTIVACISIFVAVCLAIQWIAEILTTYCEKVKKGYVPIILELETIQ